MELDKLKYDGRTNRIRRAATEALNRYPEETEFTIGKLFFKRIEACRNERIFQEYYLEKGNQDDEFIASIIAYSLNNSDTLIKIITNDTGMRLKCINFKVPTIKPPEAFQIKEEDELEKKLKAKTKELEDFRRREPKLNFCFANNKQHFEFEAVDGRQESDIVEWINNIKEKYPPLKEQTETTFSIYPKTPEKIREYNQALEVFYLECRDYYREVLEYNESKFLIFEIDLVIENIGNSPASEIDLHMHFPDGFELRHKNDFNLRPQQPEAPTLSQFKMGAPSLAHLARLPNFFPKIDLDFSPLNIKKTNSYDVTTAIKYLKHFHKEEYKCYIKFERFEDIKGFTIDYTITAGNLTHKEVGKLNISFKIKEL